MRVNITVSVPPKQAQFIEDKELSPSKILQGALQEMMDDDQNEKNGEKT